MPAARANKLRAQLSQAKRTVDQTEKSYLRAEAALTQIEDREERERSREVPRP